jgi:WD40 repeat protein
MSVAVGDRVSVRGRSHTTYRGTVRYVGTLPAALAKGDSSVFVGIELRAPHGTNSGRGLFECKPKHGLFVKMEAVLEILSGGGGGGSGKQSDYTGSAAQSHRDNDRYMNEFEEGFEALRLANGGAKRDELGTSSSAAAATRVSGPRLGLGLGYSGIAAEKIRASPNADWSSGPVDPRGVLFDASDRNILCMSLRGNMCVVGSADHGLKEFDVTKGTLTRELYSKKCGHSEWVTCVEHLPDGRVVSGGMDSKLCLWQGRRCIDMTGHSASVSSVCAGASGAHCISTSYDKTVRVWETRRGTCASMLRGHAGPILTSTWARDGDGLLLTGDRSGMACVWDLNVEKTAFTLTKHRGHVTAVHWLPGTGGGECVCVTGDQAGTVRVWDMRLQGSGTSEGCIHESVLHPGGAVNDIVSCCGPATDTSALVTTGADKNIQVMDARMGFQPRSTFAHHKDFIYSVESVGDFVASGGGDGMLLVHDVKVGKLLYGLGASEGAVRALACTAERMIAAGDDGKVLTFEF